MGSPTETMPRLFRQMMFLLEQQRSTAARTAGQTPTRFRVLVYVHDEGPVTPGDIARVLGAGTGAVTFIISALEQNGLIVRTSHPFDRRMVMLSATPACASLLRPYLTDQARLADRLAEALSWDQVQSVLLALRRH